MRRREFLGALGGATVSWPVVARAQTIPVIGYVSALSEASTSQLAAAFRRGLNEAGFLEGQNVAIEYRWANGQYDRLPGMVSELVRRPVNIIVAGAPPAALAARAATTDIPIVFIVGLDPVAAGLVNSFSRPGGNATGMSLVTGPLGQKRIELLRELVPRASVVAMLANPVSPDAAPEIRDVQTAAQANKIAIKLFNASTPNEIDDAFASMATARPDALLVGSDPFYFDRRAQITALAAQYRIVAIYPFREFVASSGLISYGTDIANSYRGAGIYAGRILKGGKPADLPVMQPTRFELVINLKTAAALGVDIPPTLHARSDEVIE